MGGDRLIAVTDALRTAVTAGLPVSVTTPNAEAPQLIADDVRMANANRVQGLVWHALDTGLVVADDNVTELARQAQLAALRTCLVAEETAVLAIDALRSAGVDARVLKGIAIAHLDHPDPSERVFGDADVLVRPSDLAQALTALDRAGFQRTEPPIRGWWERRFGKAVVLRAPNGGELDLHLRIAAGYFGERIGTDVLWEACDEFDLAGRPVHALASEVRLLHACGHAVLGGGSGLRALRDVAQLILVTRVDWSSVAERARIGGFDGLMAAAIRLAWRELRVDPEHPAMVWAAETEVAEGQLAAISASIPSSAGWTAEGWAALPSYRWVDRARFLLGLAAPSRASLRSRSRTRREHLRRLRTGER